jgi:hypothetical protein
MYRLLPVLSLIGLAACMPVATVEPVPPPPQAYPTSPQQTRQDLLDTSRGQELLDKSEVCFRENATEGELAMMVLGDERGRAVANEVMLRPATLACLERLGINLPGAPGA